MKDYLAIGKIRTSHGVHGFLKVISYSGEFDHFYALKEIRLKKERDLRIYQVDEVKPFGNGVLLKLAGLDTPEEGRLLANSEILVPRENAAPLEQDEVYAADVVGLTVYTASEIIGTVKSVCEGAGGFLLEVSREDGSLMYIPYRDEFIGSVDPSGAGIELTAEWLL